jgi:hypothetical protein
MQEAIDYYKHLFPEIMVKSEEVKISLLNNLAILEKELNSIEMQPAEESTPSMLLVKAG